MTGASIHYLPLDERGNAEAAYAVADYARPQGQRVLGFVTRWGATWTATGTGGEDRGSASRRGVAAKYLTIPRNGR